MEGMAKLKQGRGGVGVVGLAWTARTEGPKLGAGPGSYPVRDRIITMVKIYTRYYFASINTG
jgi:hypothetical protein